MIVLGIESTAHTLGMGFVDAKGEILTSVKSVYAPTEGGIHPREAAEHHQTHAIHILQKVFREAQISANQLGGVAFSQGPGLPPALRVGAVIARSLAHTLGIPLLGVNHCVAHIEQARAFCENQRPLVVFLSGGNTQITTLEAERYRIFGETLDIALGNMLDMFARAANLPHPGGPKVEALAQKANNEYVSLPYTVKGMDLAFSGLLTAAKQLIDEGIALETICYSLQETAFAMVAEVAERALAHTQRKAILTTGGVAANARLKAMLQMVADEHSAEFAAVPLEYAGDNGAMIAQTGLKMLRSGKTTPIPESGIKPKWRLDQVEIPWEV
ncbi:MAG: KEOPS complex N(6)-L-threonylcarbamoyladenine synthase Kae1 [Candidatus Hermodarchaeota archaeon]|nr:KEOPS complex N(6)-L-threonylcarbamoyladenine synthase Kae1 [Candidatus Hermodarchaeota archaeon]